MSSCPICLIKDPENPESLVRDLINLLGSFSIRPWISPTRGRFSCRTWLEKQGRAHKWCTPMDPHIWPGKSRTTRSYVRIWDVALKTCQRRWTIERSGERGSGISMPAAWRCPWCNGYRRWKWTRWNEFKSWTKLTAFHLVLIPLGKVWIQLFSLQLWVNSRTDWVLQPWWDN